MTCPDGVFGTYTVAGLLHLLGLTEHNDHRPDPAG